jgi:hypothetical protein
VGLRFELRTSFSPLELYLQPIRCILKVKPVEFGDKLDIGCKRVIKDTSGLLV